MSVYQVTPRRVCMAIVVLLGLLMLPFGSTGVKVAEWAQRKRDNW